MLRKLGYLHIKNSKPHSRLNVLPFYSNFTPLVPGIKEWHLRYESTLNLSQTNAFLLRFAVIRIIEIFGWLRTKTSSFLISDHIFKHLKILIQIYTENCWFNKHPRTPNNTLLDSNDIHILDWFLDLSLRSFNNKISYKQIAHEEIPAIIIVVPAPWRLKCVANMPFLALSNYHAKMHSKFLWNC